MAANAKNGVAKKSSKLRQFVVRLEQPGLYDRLLRKSLERSEHEGRRVPMTELVREAIERFVK